MLLELKGKYNNITNRYVYAPFHIVVYSLLEKDISTFADEQQLQRFQVIIEIGKKRWGV